MQFSSHEIGSHSLAHCNLTMLDKNNLDRDISQSRELFNDNELAPITSFAYPYGQYNDETQEVLSMEFDYIRTADVGYNDRYFDPTNIRSLAVYDTTTAAEFESWLDFAAKNRLWLVVAFHRVDETGDYSISSAQFERQLQLIKDSGLMVLPLSETAKSIEL
jgi:peptidoglycan/xylan/chitin deacetylase (PgdA/CDA1 family)